MTGVCWLCRQPVQTAPGSSAAEGSRKAMVAGLEHRLGYRIEAGDTEALICDACLERQVLQGLAQK